MDGTGVHKGLDPGAVCVVLLTQANGSDTPGLALAPSPSRPLGAGRRGGELHTHPPPHPPTPPPSLLSVLRTGVWVRVRGVNSLAKHPERVGTGPKDKKRLQIQLTWQNRPNLYHPVPPLPGAREGRGSLEGVEIFQMLWIAKRFTPVCRSRCGAGGAGRGAGAGTALRPRVPHRLRQTGVNLFATMRN